MSIFFCAPQSYSLVASLSRAFISLLFFFWISADVVVTAAVFLNFQFVFFSSDFHSGCSNVLSLYICLLRSVSFSLVFAWDQF